PPRGDAERNRDLSLGFLELGFAPRGPRRPPRPAATKNGRKNIAQTAAIGHVEFAAVGWSAAAAPRSGSAATAPKAAGPGKRAVATELIVFLALVGVAQHVVRFVDFLEAVGGLRIVGIAVGMMLLGQPPEGLLDLVRRGGFSDSQQLIVVALCCHYCP